MFETLEILYLRYDSQTDFKLNDPLGNLKKLPPPEFHFTDYNQFNTNPRERKKMAEQDVYMYGLDLPINIGGGGWGASSGFGAFLIQYGNDYLAHHSGETDIDKTFTGDEILAKYESVQNVGGSTPSNNSGTIFSYTYYTDSHNEDDGNVEIHSTRHTTYFRMPGFDDQGEVNQGGDKQASFSQIPWLTAGNVNNDKGSLNSGTVPPFEFEIDANRSRTHNGMLHSIGQPYAFPNTGQWTDENGVHIRANVYDVHWIVAPAIGSIISYGEVGFSITYTYSDGSPSIHQDLTRMVFIP